MHNKLPFVWGKRDDKEKKDYEEKIMTNGVPIYDFWWSNLWLLKFQSMTFSVPIYDSLRYSDSKMRRGNWRTYWRTYQDISECVFLRIFFCLPLISSFSSKQPREVFQKEKKVELYSLNLLPFGTKLAILQSWKPQMDWL